ncbi:bifunctional DNA primase/polymerase [Segniliparus rugosus]|uniref:DNA primase/polymerase bifunctional N-terminal domain-containing protein n=1 Tax=Segniliparus rugosus (strain ATCC BAA-974 / DSM 45345 / CCUG 50838 / CIP 108380 / JCM 13579 / CDC 945) TaxID=679197 RepID=E5XT30_SEGRC|nr:bifunctional DNA primase/polymerase [Segniliparus rugosus]EFV12501.1 hypothetical protein HMPREF9336_02652 [Segniliparus rugosus ATCC BAA-974]
MNEKYEGALRLAKLGWAVIPVHYVVPSTGVCSCGNADPKHSTGKHPIRGGWQNGPAATEADVYSLFMEENPRYNVGVRTGKVSGFFALDVDPRHGGDETLAALVAEHGALPATVVVRTGSGGQHYYFQLPEDFEVGNNKSYIGDGLDVRGKGGFVVAPPSASGEGGYRFESDPETTAIAPAPEWLLELLRPKANEQEAEAVVVEDLPDRDGMPESVQRRYDAYARAAVASEADLYRNAPLGRGNDALFTAACNGFEISNSPWNAVTGKDVRAALEAARVERAKWRGAGGGQTEEEFRKTVDSARNTTTGKGRRPPEEREDKQIGGDEVDDMHVLDDHVKWLLDQFVDSQDVDAAPDRRPLIKGILKANSEAWMIGLSGDFKSFVALDMAMHVACGRKWRDRKTKQGKVVYIAGEGSDGLMDRIRAWERVYDEKPERGALSFLPMPVQAAKLGDWWALVKACEQISPALIVIDTQARMTVGLDENSAKDMGIYVEAVRKLRQHTSACVLTIHHVGRNGGDARGSSALDGAQDTEIRVERDKKSSDGPLSVRISLDKQKDGSTEVSSLAKMRVVELGVDEDGDKVTSLALEPFDPFAQPKPALPDHIANLSENQGLVYEVLREFANHENGATVVEIQGWLLESPRVKKARGSISSALTALVEKDKVVRLGKTRFVLKEHTC